MPSRWSFRDADLVVDRPDGVSTVLTDAKRSVRGQILVAQRLVCIPETNRLLNILICLLGSDLEAEENIVAPVSIILSIPFAFSGAFLALLITQNPLSIFSMIGIIMLMGLVTKNAILLVDFTQQRIKEGLKKEAALTEAARVRWRPFIMTTLTMIV